MSKYSVPAETFVVAYQASKSLAEAATKLGMPATNVANRARDYRKRGVHLKLMPVRRQRLDVQALNRLIRATD